MSKIKQFGMAAGTFSVALGIGFVMQNGDALADRFGAETESQQPTLLSAPDDQSFESEGPQTE